MAKLAREEEIREALRDGLDPEVGIDIADLGLIKEIIISDDDKVEVDNGADQQGLSHSEPGIASPDGERQHRRNSKG